MGEVQKNVYELAQERLHIIFKEFDNICVSFSGGKDSGVLLNLCIDCPNIPIISPGNTTFAEISAS
mgnify:CR=1 FL=1